MTDISESGIEAALAPCPFCGWEARIVSGGPGNHFVQCLGCRATSDDMALDRAVSNWNRRHPPASREEGLRSALAHVEAVRVSPQWSGKNADWICGAIRFELEQDLLSALIPTKPEAKEDYSDTIAWLRDDAERRTDGIVGNEGRLKPEQTHQWRAAEALSRISASLQSKKPE